jgi:hypothetical protein
VSNREYKYNVVIPFTFSLGNVDGTHFQVICTRKGALNLSNVSDGDLANMEIIARAMVQRHPSWPEGVQPTFIETQCNEAFDAFIYSSSPQ